MESQVDLNIYRVFHNEFVSNKYLFINELLKRKDSFEIVSPKCNFNPNSLDESSCIRFFRFKKTDLWRLKNALRLPDLMRCDNRLSFTGIEGLCILLRRLAYPNRFWDISNIFNRKQPDLSRIFNATLNYVYETFGCLLTRIHYAWMDINKMQEYADAIHRAGSPFQNCIGFIDGTLRATCRPKIGQREMYSGHKRKHGIKFQAVTSPDGMILNLFGPELARRHDSYILAQSGILQRLETDVPNYIIFGDQGYPLRPQLMVSYQGNLTQPQIDFNNAMSPLRVSVEWEFGKTVSLFAFLDFKKNLKILQQPVGKYYIVGTLLKNCHNCLYGSQSSTYFGVNPPNLENYLSSVFQ